MKNKVLKAVVTMGVVAVLSACGDDPAGPNPGPTSSTSNDPCASVVAISDAWLFTADQTYVIYPDGRVTDAAGNVVGQFAEGVITALGGTQIAAGVDVGVLKVCPANATVNPDGSIVPNSSAAVVPGSSADVGPASSADVLPGSSAVIPGSSAAVDPNSSAAVDPNSSASVDPESSAEVVPESSSSVKNSGNPEEDIKNYPVAAYKNLLAAGTTQKGWNSRYWDSCKPHCSWMDNIDTSSQAAYAAAGYTSRNCNINDIEIPTFTLSKGLQQYWWGMEGVPSSCDIGAGGAFTCTDMAPIKVNDTLSYGFVAGPSNQGCGKCYHLQYDGSTSNTGDGGPDVKETHIALKGKHMVVMASNIGHDVDPKSTQFDLLVPGGGVGIFNALSTQIGKAPEELGSTNGGVLSYCMQKLGYWQVTKEQYQECVIEKCDVVFDSTTWPHLNRGCKWLATFFEAADNPTFVWEEVECPQYLVDKYQTTISLELETNVLYSEKWDNYKGDGQYITTDACSRTPNAKGENCDPDQLAADKAKSY